MIVCRRYFAVAAVVAVAFLLPNGQPKAAELSAGAQSLVAEMADKVIARLTDPAIGRGERKARMRTMMAEYFFIEGIAQWVLGRHWRGASADERAEYLALYERLMIETYVDRFASYEGETIKVIGVEVRGGKDAIVKSVVDRPSTGQSIAVDWRIREFDGAFKVIDIMIEGVSMGQTQRSEFGSAIKNNGGDLAAFLESLRQRVETASAASN